MADEDEPLVTPGLTLSEMIQSKRAVHKFVQGNRLMICNKRNFDDKESTTNEQ